METIELRLPEELLSGLDRRAHEAGSRNRADYIRGLIERDIERQTSLDENLRPFREEVKASGITDEELTALFEEAREEVWLEKQARTERGT